MLLSVYESRQNWRGATHTFPCGFKTMTFTRAPRSVWYSESIQNSAKFWAIPHSVQYFQFTGHLFQVNGTILSEKKNVRMCSAHIEFHYWLWVSLQAQCRRNRVSASRRLQDGRFVLHHQKTKRALIYNSAFLKCWTCSFSRWSR